MNNKKKLILIGGGGHCRSIIDVIEAENTFEIAGIVDHNKSEDIKYPVLGGDNDLPELIKKYKNVVISTGQIKSASTRVKLYKIAKKLGGKFPIIVSPNSYVSKNAKIKEGTVIMHHAVINSCVKIGVNTIINTGAIVEHDSTIGDFCHISTKAVINGGSQIGDYCFFGSGSVIIENKMIPSNCIIGAGSVVNKSLLAPGTYAGVPCKKTS